MYEDMSISGYTTAHCAHRHACLCCVINLPIKHFVALLVLTSDLVCPSSHGGAGRVEGVVEGGEGVGGCVDSGMGSLSLPSAALTLNDVSHYR